MHVVSCVEQDRILGMIVCPARLYITGPVQDLALRWQLGGRGTMWASAAPCIYTRRRFGTLSKAQPMLINI